MTVSTATARRTLRPLGERVVLRVSHEATTSSGLVIPDTVDQGHARGVVVAVGPGRVLDSGELVPVPLSAGDTVVFSSFAPSSVDLDGEEYLVVSAADVLAVVEDAEAGLSRSGSASAGEVS